MILSTFQYQAPYINSVYSDAMAQAGRAAFVQVGGQKTQDDLSKYGLKEAHEAGLTDIEMGLVGGAVKTIRNRSLTVKGPKVFDAKTDLTATQNSGTLFIKWEW